MYKIINRRMDVAARNGYEESLVSFSRGTRAHIRTQTQYKLNHVRKRSGACATRTRSPETKRIHYITLHARLPY